nr:hypothetical protein [Tanacetum cinerariifolium]
MKYTRLLKLAKQLRKCKKLSKGYNKPEWSRFVTIVKQEHKLDEVSYHKFFDILKQYQKEVNELRAERLARDANPLALRTVNLAGATENVGSPVVQQSGIQCFNYKEFGHFAKEYRKPKRVKDFAYMAKIQDVPTADSGTDCELLEQGDLHSSGNGNTFHWQWEIILPVGTPSSSGNALCILFPTILRY